MTALLIFITAGLGLQGPADTTAIDVMTFNVRYDNPADGDHRWEYRRERVATIMQRADVIGAQELLKGQLTDLEGMLPGYQWFGVGRDDGVQGGEFAPVFYREDRFELLTWGTFWLSDQPDLPGSVGWDAALPRIVTWGRLRHRTSGQVLWIFNTHFDHRGREARRESARLIMERIDDMAGATPVIVTGDFNAGHNSMVHRTMTEGRLEDARHYVQAEPVGPEGTFSGFEGGTGMSVERIDYIFADESLPVYTFEVIDEVMDGHYPSDHRPVVARIGLR